MVVESRPGRATAFNAGLARRLFSIYHLLFTLQQPFRRVHANEPGGDVYLDADALGQWDEVFAPRFVAYDEDGGLSAGVEHLAHGAHVPPPDRLDAAAFELPVVELALFQLDRLGLRHGQLAARERGGRLRRVEALELEDDAVAVEPVTFERQPLAPAAGEDRDEFVNPLEALGEVGQKLTGDLA